MVAAARECAASEIFRAASARCDVGAVKRFQRRGVGAVTVVVLRGGAVGEIAVALSLWLQSEQTRSMSRNNSGCARPSPSALMPSCSSIWQLVGGVLAVADQRLQIVRRDPEVARDAVEIGAIELPHLVHLAAMLQPTRKGFDSAEPGPIPPRLWAPAQQRTAEEALRCVRGTRVPHNGES